MKNIKLLLLILFLNSCDKSNVPPGFSKIESIEPPILLDIRYSGSDNFLGRTVVGYENPKNILTNETIKALTKIQKILSKNGLDHFLKEFFEFLLKLLWSHWSIYFLDFRIQQQFVLKNCLSPNILCLKELEVQYFQFLRNLVEHLIYHNC